jgi:hypothetical protein
MVDVRVFSTLSQEGLLMQQQPLHELLQDLDLPDWNTNTDLMSWLSSL